MSKSHHNISATTWMPSAAELGSVKIFEVTSLRQRCWQDCFPWGLPVWLPDGQLPAAPSGDLCHSRTSLVSFPLLTRISVGQIRDPPLRLSFHHLKVCIPTEASILGKDAVAVFCCYGRTVSPVTNAEQEFLWLTAHRLGSPRVWSPH